MKTYKYFQLNTKPVQPKRIVFYMLTLLLIACISSIPIATYFNSNKLSDSIQIQNLNVNGKVGSVYKNGKYENPWPSYKRAGFGSLLKFAIIEKDKTNLPSNESELNSILPIHYLEDKEINEFCQQKNESQLKAIWIGHSTTLVNLDNLIILTDPMFSSRASPVQIMGPKRFRSVPIGIPKLPRVDVVVISHNHYDHLDYESVVNLNNKFGDNITWLVPLGVGEWFRSIGIVNNMHEFDWWETKNIKNAEITFVPAQHWSGRGILDRSKTLWGGWTFNGPTKKVYFAGDTGYCSVFEEIGANQGPFDLSLIPIGAYEPRWFMQPQHVNPEEAVKIHMEVKSKQSVGIHWGTFHMAHEYFMAPKQDLEAALEKYSLNKSSFLAIQHGAVYTF